MNAFRHPPSGRRRPRSGFTLVELLVTLVILSTGIVLVLQAFETSMTALSESRDALRASALVQSLVAGGELVLRHGGASSSREAEAGLRKQYPEYSWDVAVEPADMDSCTNHAWDAYSLAILLHHRVTGRETGARTVVLVPRQ